jgi:hypothetical protein
MYCIITLRSQQTGAAFDLEWAGNDMRWSDLRMSGSTNAPVGWLQHGTWQFDHGANSIKLFEGPGGTLGLAQPELVLVLQNTGHNLMTEGPMSGVGHVYRSANTDFQGVDVQWERSQAMAGSAGVRSLME